MMERNRILELLAKKMGNAASESELQELQDLLQEFPEHLYLIDVIESIETNKSSRLPHRNEETIVQENWNSLQQKLGNEQGEKTDLPVDRQSRKLIHLSPMSRAAVIGGLLVISAGLWFTLSKKSASDGGPQPVSVVQQLQVPFGEPDREILPDGSEVWVNAGSRIRYAYDVDKNTREIYLEGEAFFKVKHDPQHPFIVHAGNISVTALGTEFNVEAYKNDNTIKTTLIEGKVQITMAEKPEQKIILSPNEKLSVIAKELPANDESFKKEISYKVEHIEHISIGSPVTELAWIEDKLAFQNEAFYELSKRMERRYNIHVIFRDASLKKESLTGTFENETIQKALNLLQMTTPFRYRMEGDSVFLFR
jgi:transmembrane sensor